MLVHFNAVLINADINTSMAIQELTDLKVIDMRVFGNISQNEKPSVGFFYFIAKGLYRITR